MSTRFLPFVLAFVAVTSFAAALDLRDFDEDAMRAVEDAGKELESSIPGQDAPTTVANAEFVRDSLRWAEGYFAKKGGVEDAVKLAQQGQEQANAIALAAKAKNFDGASDSFVSLKQTCKRCHDAYKPPKL